MQILDIAIQRVLENVRLAREKDIYNKKLEEKLRKGTSDLEQRSIELEKAYHNLNREIEERRRAEEIIQQENTFIQTIIEGVRDPAMIVSPDFGVLMMNQAALAILPSKQTRLGQLTCYQAYRQADTPCTGEDHRCVLKEVLKTGKCFEEG